MNRVIRVRQRWSLPHWETDGGIYFVTFRLFDSFPAHVVDAFAALPLPERFPDGPLRENATLARIRFIEKQLDRGYGDCWLRRGDIAELVSGALVYFDGERYALDEWCVMPNHVHVVVQPFGDLEAVLASWKSFTAHEANKLLNRQGPFWQKESFDQLIRDGNDLARTRRYIQLNPLKAGLKNWTWCSAGLRPRSLGEGRRDGGTTR